MAPDFVVIERRECHGCFGRGRDLRNRACVFCGCSGIEKREVPLLVALQETGLLAVIGAAIDHLRNPSSAGLARLSDAAGEFAQHYSAAVTPRKEVPRGED